MIFLQKRILAVVVIAISMMTMAFHANAQNMLTNPGFENWTGGKPDGWFGERSNIAATNVVQYTGDVHGGSSACQLINAESSNKRLTSKAVSVVKDQTYTITFWVRGHGDCRSGLWDGQGTGGDNYIYDSQVINVNSNSWAQQTFSVTAPASVNNAEFIILVRNTNADKDHLQFDDVIVTGGGASTLKADFQADKTTATTGSVINFTDLSTGTPLKWEWSVRGAENFTSSEKNPSFTFNLAGSYDVSLIVSDEETSNELTKLAYITIGDYIFFQDWNTKDDWKGWTKVNVLGAQEWKFTTEYGIDNSPCIQMSGHDGTSAVENEDWLISPEFKLTENNIAVLNFWNAYKYDGNPLKLYFSNNYDGNISDATWSELSFTMSSGNFVWVNSGNISLKSFSGDHCYIAFKYTSTNTASSSWELDNISLKETNLALYQIDENSLSIYPNPSTGIFNFKTTETSHINVYTVDGRLIHEQTMLPNGNVDLSNCIKGNYIMQIIFKNGYTVSKKIVIK